MTLPLLWAWYKPSPLLIVRPWGHAKASQETGSQCLNYTITVPVVVSRGLTEFIIYLESSENLLLMVELGSLSLSVDSSTSELCGDVGTSKSCLGLMIHRHATNANNRTTTRIVGCKINFHFFVCHQWKFHYMLLKRCAVKLMLMEPSGCQHKHDYDFDISSNSVDKLFPWQNVWILSIMITGGGMSSIRWLYILSYLNSKPDFKLQRGTMTYKWPVVKY